MAATATIAEGWNFAPQPRRRSRFTSLQAERSLGLLTRALCNTGFTATSGFGGWEVPDFLLTFLYPSPSAPLLKPDCPLPHSMCLQRRFPLLGTWGVGWSLRSGIRGSWAQILSHHAGGHCAHCLTSLSLSRQGEEGDDDGDHTHLVVSAVHQVLSHPFDGCWWVGMAYGPGDAGRSPHGPASLGRVGLVQ